MSNQVKTIQEIIEESVNILYRHNIENPLLEAQLLLGHVLSFSRTSIILKSNEAVAADKLALYKTLLERKSRGEPTAYILGHQEFYGREFQVCPDVLIPRPETEELVEWILESGSHYDSILDLCTGSGCIGITLGLEATIRRITLSDISDRALSVAQSNARKLAPDRQFEILQSDLYRDTHASGFDLIVSNPPYVTREEYIDLDRSVKDYEPEAALLIKNPADFNRRLIEGAILSLNSGGRLYLETNPVFIKDLVTLMEDAGFRNILIKKDLSGKERFIQGYKIP